MTLGILIGYQRYGIMHDKVKDGYTVYLDETEIETDNIRFSKYIYITVNDKDKTIRLEYKRRRNYVYGRWCPTRVFRPLLIRS